MIVGLALSLLSTSMVGVSGAHLELVLVDQCILGKSIVESAKLRKRQFGFVVVQRGNQSRNDVSGTVGAGACNVFKMKTSALLLKFSDSKETRSRTSDTEAMPEFG